ncbi:TonB system transport protein ExbD1 [Vibrio ichthyoenteri ATCC 700023]|uniref:TonB system transport protein ExbD1 n=1 Tax=Vibrio ichthyoenteri ATCC 700023 TaxID=870968 RepID=F9RZB0_9VIBR|nr:biopolymer transporter ExbD [Vibrio ichthyoenteri]EGU45512.1 TonB system transport protein ExbD1 [Vibrio ichthyoenteri ATCC 700023]
MIQSHSQFSDEEFKPDLTPMLDIIFIVMVFLLLTANVSVQTLNVDIPKTEESSALTRPDKPVISIGILHTNTDAATANKWAVDGTEFSDWAQFTTALLEARQQTPDKPIVIAADKKADVESMLNLLAFMQKHHISATNIVMEER